MTSSFMEGLETNMMQTWRNVYKLIQDKGLKLNKPKCKFLTKSLNFFGQIYTEVGTQPDPKRVQDLNDAPVSTSIQEVRSLLGMANYSSKYISNFATITEPLRALTKKNAIFQWTGEQQSAFVALKNALSRAPCMAYFNTNKDTTVTVDASPVGISAILSQNTPKKDDNKIVAYASRSLTLLPNRKRGFGHRVGR